MPDDVIEDLPHEMRPGPPEGWERVWGWATRYGLAVVITLGFGMPLLWMVLTSLRPLGLPPASRFEWVPPAMSLGNYPHLFNVFALERYLFNSLAVVAVAVPLTLVTASMAGYALIQLPPRWRGVITAVSIAALLVPSMALWVTRFLVYKWLAILDTPLALIAPALMGTSPLYVLLFSWAFGRLPRDIYDQARIDGASAFRTWWTISLPLIRPAITAVAVLTLVFYWSDFISPLLYINNQEWQTLPVGIQALQQMDKTNWPLLMAGAVVLTTPILVMFVVAQRYFFQEERGLGWLGR